MTAHEAEELMHGSKKHKGLWYKLRLNWMCGRFNQVIEHRAERGEHDAAIAESVEIALQYFPLMAQFYANQGYHVFWNVHKLVSNMYLPCLRVVWAWDKLEEWERSAYYDRFRYWLPEKGGE